MAEVEVKTDPIVLQWVRLYVCFNVLYVLNVAASFLHIFLPASPTQCQTIFKFV